MKPVSPVIPDENWGEKEIAKDQDEYRTLPAIVCDDGTVISRWELSEEELLEVMETKSIYLTVMTFNRGLSPVLLDTKKPVLYTQDLENETSDVIG